jgi:hypothetical protein
VQVTFDDVDIFDPTGADEEDYTMYLNKANRNENVESNQGHEQLKASYEEYNDTYSLITPQVHGWLSRFLFDDSYHIGHQHLKYNGQGYIRTHTINDDEDVPASNKIYAYGWMTKGHSGSGGNTVHRIFLADADDTTKMGLLFDTEADNWMLLINGELYPTDDPQIDPLLKYEGTYFICVSFSDDPSISNFPMFSVFIKYLDPSHEYFGAFISWQFFTSNQNSGDLLTGITHYEFFGGDEAGINPSGRVDNLNIVHNKYMNGIENKDMQHVWNIAHQQPPFRNQLGLTINMGFDPDTDPGTLIDNDNISFGRTKKILDKEYRNMVRWSNVNSNSIPELNYKLVNEPIIKLIGAPSFLQYQYQNTFLIFTRNNIHRFILDPNVEGWGGSASSLIDEKTQYGLLAPRSLVRVAEGLFWLSETGVVKWDPKGFNLISKNRINIPINEKSIGFYNSLENQYILWCNDQAYVYHIDRDLWVTFSGSDLVNILEVSTLTGGTREDNVNLLLTKDPIIAEGEPGIYKIYEYPSSEITENDSSIKTKDMFFEKGVLKRVKLNYKEGDSEYSRTILISNITKNDKDGNEIIKSNEIGSIENGKWRGVSNANSRGKSVNFEVKNADEIESIMYDIKLLSRVKQ